MFDVHSILSSLAIRRPLFHSEADFQHEFAWELRSLAPEWSVRLEVPSSEIGVGTTDIVARRGELCVGVELKYLTKRLNWNHAGEEFALKAQGATDLRRYDVLKDVQRMERFNSKFRGPSFVIALTNEAAYWNNGPKRPTIDADFRLNQGRSLQGQLLWTEHAAPGTIKGRAMPIELHGQYSMDWRDYSQITTQSGVFRYLCIAVMGSTNP